ncbi:hypothetical protein NUH88_00695 [Nisaea acidiphila]|uniref:Flagellar protein FliL n=1 Tax=Nisaea acidiphila TaxID=1862145 RepID=A0A9J7AUT7_9PROT|nr:hypothetical protein [Nisaea acidiphila]UUX50225.1 hypothetical protein NUH88_00695 [Nisaea acidiphila]
MKIVIILVILIALAGGGVFGVSMFAPGLLPPMVLEMLGQEVPPEEEKAVKERPSVTQLVDLEPLSIPIFKDGQVDRFLVLHIFIEVEPGPNFELVNRDKVRIIDAYLKYVHALSSLDIKPGIKDLAFLKQRLLAKTEEIVGEGVIVDLLFQNVFERPLQG